MLTAGLSLRNKSEESSLLMANVEALAETEDMIEVTCDCNDDSSLTECPVTTPDGLEYEDGEFICE